MCHRLLILCVTIAAAAAAGPAHALTVDEIVAKNIEAHGGLTAIRAIKTVRVTGRFIGGGDSSRVEMAYGQLVSRAGKLRDELTRQGFSEVRGFDGREGWTFDPTEGRRTAERVSADEAKIMAQDADIDGPLVDWKQKGHRLEYLGTEDIDGTAALKLRVTLKDGDVKYVYLDPDAFLEIRVQSVAKIRGVEYRSEVDLGSYQKVAGVYFPFTYATGMPNQPRGSRFVIDRVEVNVPVDDALFAFPSGAVAAAILAGPPSPPEQAAPPPVPQGAPAFDAGLVSGLGARNIGSARMSGRVSAIAGVNVDGKTTLYAGSASGGVWKSMDGGTTFKPVFDKMPVQSIGAIAIDPREPRNVWVGTGESWTRNSVSIGDGIYRSTDGGDTWSQVGLPESERVSRIIVHPRSSDTVYACVPGKLWSDSPDRGLYKTTDGGKSWSLILKGPNLSTGCSGLAMDPKDPEVIFAGLWDFRRTGWSYRSGGDGPTAASGSAMFRSSDGGKTWRKLDASTAKGLPAAPWGRLEIAIAPTDSRIVYAFIENVDSALYRSSDGGVTWEQRDKSQFMVWRPFYFARLIVDPSNAERLFKAGYSLIVSEDGGKSFDGAGGGGHGDWHDVWIDPQNPKHMVGGDDGGLWISYDGGSRYWKCMNLPISQFYHVTVDNKDPYQVYGGLQDNSSWVGDSAYPGGITNARWESLYFGDGFNVVTDPGDADYVYAEAQGGNIARVNRKTLARRKVQPFAGYKEQLRFNWNAPIHASPTQKSTIYIGAQFLFRSRDHGDTWERISPDLTTNDPARQQQEQSGGITVDNSEAEMHTTISTVSESPKDPRTIWAGTDDGNLQITRDGGRKWTNVVTNVNGLPPKSWVTTVEASRFDARTAYATFDRHTYGDMTPYVYKTTDAGVTWTRIVAPDQGVRGYAHVIKEDTVSPAVLFLGTELGLWISVDGGGRWAQFTGSGFPPVAVRDLQVHPRDQDLVIATHGRGIWIIDDISPLRALAAADVLGKSLAFLPGRPAQQRLNAFAYSPDGDATFRGRNPASAAMITYYQRARHLYGPLSLEILDANGKVVDTLTGGLRRGINRVPWPMVLPPPRVPRAASSVSAATEGPRMLPGTYTIRLKKGSEVFETKLTVGLDRRATFTLADRKAELDAALRVVALFGEMSDVVDRIDAVQGGAAARAAALPPDDDLRKRLEGFSGRLVTIKKKIVATKEGGAITGEKRLREHLDEVYGAIVGHEGRPAKYQLARIDVLARELGDVKGALTAALVEVTALDDTLRSRKLEPLPSH